MKPAKHPECGQSCLGPHPDYCQSMSDCWLKGQPVSCPIKPGFRKPRKRQTAAERIRELEAEVARLREQIKQAERDRALIDPRTGRERDLICRARDTRASLTL